MYQYRQVDGPWAVTEWTDENEEGIIAYFATEALAVEYAEARAAEDTNGYEYDVFQVVVLDKAV